jgi:hypothetical protein
MDRLRLQLNSRREHNTIAPNDECTINGRKLPDGLLRPPPEARPFTRPGATCAIGPDVHQRILLGGLSQIFGAGCARGRVARDV